ncbi:MAG TPA: VWA domain-containing protein [Terracidiphilus sp.]|nr:VWA domain-containing protein [Terracidiphilus sp.]
MSIARRLPLIGCLAVLSMCSIPSHGLQAVTVSQLESSISGLEGKSDADAAWHIAGMELTQQLSANQLAKLEKLVPGDKSRQALVALADESAFLDLPADEIPARAAPDLARQRRMMSRVVEYVSKTIPQLPNFFATRITNRLEDTPQVETVTGLIPYQPMHAVGTSSVTVLYRDGREVVDPGTGRKQMASAGLQTLGVFGPMLSTVLLDAARNRLGWSHWEQGPKGMLAVFKYEVPQDKSHYRVNYCCVATQSATEAADVHLYHKVVGYRGEMTIEPETGTIKRLTVIADVKAPEPVVRADILVDYGPVGIGGKTYTCPTKSVSVAVAQSVQRDPRYRYALAEHLQPLRTSLSEVAFEKYHVFRSNARILTPEEARLAAEQPEHEAAASSATPEEAAATGPEKPHATSEPEDRTTTAPAAASGAGESKAPAPSARADEGSTPATTSAATALHALQPAQPEINRMPLTSLPTLPAAVQTRVNESGFVLRTTSRLVDVSVVAFDKKGRPITNLKPGDFEVFDNGVKQKVRFFSQAGEVEAGKPAAEQARIEDTNEPPVFSNQAKIAMNGDSGVMNPPGETTILMIDASSLAFGDLTRAREEMLRFLSTMPSEERVGLYVRKAYSFQALQEPTSDTALLAETLKHWMPSAQDLARAQAAEKRNRHQMDYVDNAIDLLSVNGGSPMGMSAAAQPTSPQLLALGSNPARDSLVILPGIARHLAMIAGHKSLIWVASDNVLADWSDQAASNESGGNHIAPLVLGAQEALNAAHVSIYPLDASQLEAGGVGANLSNANVQLNPAAADSAGIQLSTLPPSEQEEAKESLEKSQRNINPGRAADRIKQDTHPISTEFRELAEATGGSALRRAGDIANELHGIVDDGRAAYQLSFVPTLPADGKYHRITVKVKDRRKIALRYRTGYLAAKEPATMKERISQAIWQPEDMSEIAMSATPAVDSKGSLLRLKIAGTDLDVAQSGKVWADRLDIFLVDRPLDGLHAKVTGERLGLQLQPATYQRILREGLTFDQRLQSKPGEGALRVVVVDENSSRIGTVTMPALALKQPHSIPGR